MNQILLNKKETNVITRSLITDILLLAVIYLLPTISHLLAFPLYLLDPMRIVIFASILLSCNKFNSYLFAATIPLFSYFIGGHPVLLKSIIISIELLVNVILFWLMLQRWKNVFYATLISIIVAKMIYYFLKCIFVEIGWIQMDIVSTSVWLQMVVTASLSLFMYFYCRYDY